MFSNNGEGGGHLMPLLSSTPLSIALLVFPKMLFSHLSFLLLSSPLFCLLPSPFVVFSPALWVRLSYQDVTLSHTLPLSGGKKELIRGTFQRAGSSEDGVTLEIVRPVLSAEVIKNNKNHNDTKRPKACGHPNITSICDC